MNRFAEIVGFSGALVTLLATSSPGTRADQVDRPLSEGQAMEAGLNGNASAVTYWVSEPDGWHVVTMVDRVIAQNGDAETHAVVRFEAVLLPGQSQAISVPFPIGQQLRILRIRDPCLHRIRIGVMVQGSSGQRNPGGEMIGSTESM